MPVSLRLTLPSQGLKVTPGDRVEFTATVQNTGDSLAEFRLTLAGIDPSWYTSSTATVTLFPGDYQQVRLVIHPPRVSGARAGKYEAKLEASSTKEPGDRADMTLVLEVLPFRDYEVEMRPSAASGRGACRFRLSIANKGGEDLSFALDGKDREESLRYQFTPAEPRVPAGQKTEVIATVAPKRWKLTGPPVRRNFTITAKPTGESEGKSQEGELESKGLVPRVILMGLTVVAVMIVGAGVALATGIFPPKPGAPTPAPTARPATVTPVPAPTARPATVTPIRGPTRIISTPRPIAALRVVGVALNAPPAYRGPCPTTVKFEGKIAVDGGAGKVVYRFVRSDGGVGPAQTLTFASSPASQAVSTTWTLSPAQPFKGWMKIEIVDPQTPPSGPASFAVECTVFQAPK